VFIFVFPFFGVVHFGVAQAQVVHAPRGRGDDFKQVPDR
jgi:hypothetical protein